MSGYPQQYNTEYIGQYPHPQGQPSHPYNTAQPGYQYPPPQQPQPPIPPYTFAPPPGQQPIYYPPYGPQGVYAPHVPPGSSTYPSQTHYPPQPPVTPQTKPTCTGKKKALLIGINYFGQRGQLRGCINDVKNMSKFLMDTYGYERENMVILTDDQQNALSQPTKQNILQAMHWLVKDAEPNDSLFFHYSGHGGQTKDLDGDENDGYDETIYPMDFRYNGHIVDDDMHAIMVAPLKAGVRLTAIFDSCHSGSALDLPYLYSTQGDVKETNRIRDAHEGIIDALRHYSRGDVPSVISTTASIIKKVTSGREADQRARKTRTSPADVIQWSGSKDTQKSADTTEGGQATGAMSHAFISALRKNPHQSYQQLLQNIRIELEGKYAQKPQLSCSHPIDTSMLYVM